ncbi:MAG: Fic family protein [Parachlamydia sp.]|jgi:fido (protein-threonine AMPylation protein)|nr:Fic family protein [Parachlamydia sp.]
MIPLLWKTYLFLRGRGLFLENIKSTKDRRGINTKFSQSALEERLDRMARIYGEEELNLLRTQAREVASRLKMEKEFKILDRLIGSFLGTHNETVSLPGIARGKGEPYDPMRFELFAILSAYLQQQDLLSIKQTLTKQGEINRSFFEAYFSNYIEGTIFEIEEAERIIFDGKIFPHRSEDSHDILSTFQIISNSKWMEKAPQNGEELVQILKHRHSILMEARKDKMPGRFKEIANRAGSTHFVKPEEVRGTLLKGFEFYQKLPVGIKKAIFMMFLVSEVHPFLDGNGRIARVLMNAELDIADESRIIIPTVFREDYLLALRRLSQKMDPSAYVKMLVEAQRFTAPIHFNQYTQSLSQLVASNAFMEPSEGRLKF